MALIECKNCGNMISDKATTCPKCGVGVNQQQTDDAVADLMYREALDALKRGKNDDAWSLIEGLLAVRPEEPRFLELKEKLEIPTNGATHQSNHLISCEHCGQMVSPRAKKCPKCGQSVSKEQQTPHSAVQQNKEATQQIKSNLIACRHCGHPMSAKAAKCPKCGALTSLGEVVENERKEQEQKRNEELRQLQLKQKAENNEKNYQSAMSYLHNGNCAEAIRLVNQLLSDNPDDEKYKKLKTEIDVAIEKRSRNLCETIKNCLDSGRLEHAQEDMRALINLGVEESSFSDLKNQLENALWQRELETEKAARRKKILIGVVASLVSALLLGVGLYLYHCNKVKQDELVLWRQVEQEGELSIMNEYLIKYPDGEHATQVQDMKAKIQEISDQWSQLESTSDDAALKDFINKCPVGPYHDKAVNALDNLLWNRVITSNTPADYKKYLDNCPSGPHVEEARQWLQQRAEQDAELQARMQLTSDESNIVSYRIRSFFNAMANGDATTMADFVSTPMTSFLGKRNATSSDVIAYMRRVHSGDVYSVDVTMGNISIKKSLTSDGSPLYTASFGFDQRLGREDNTQETFAHYNGTATLNADCLITSIGLNKTSHY